MRTAQKARNYAGKAFLISITIFGGAFGQFWGNAILGAQPDQGARSVLEQFWRYEEREEYERSYSLLSTSFKRSLKEESGITNGNEYKRMRKFQALRFLSPQIEQQILGGMQGSLFSVEATYEQYIYGKRIEDKIEFSVMMLKEQGKWVIDKLFAGMDD